MFVLFVIIPLAIAAFLAVLMRHAAQKYIRYVALAGSLASLVLIIQAYYNTAQIQTTGWFSFYGYSFALSTSTMPLNMLLLFIVGLITPLIILYSIGFMEVPSEQSRYYSELCLFAAAMLLFAMAADFLTLFLGWELLGLTSYLLIGFWYKRQGTSTAARKAVTIALIGDVLMLMAMVIIWSSYHTFSFAGIFSQVSPVVQTGTIEAALILIMLAAFTKSAQFPFQEWLPDAMKGPTPVSAFLHSSTMVKAGIFLIAVLLPFFVLYHLLYLLLIFGIITAILGVTNALAETHLKRILAYSTIEDLGLMFIALSTGSVLAAMLLFVVQTFYKALLFMDAGAILKANNNEESLEKIYNGPSNLRFFIPIIIGVACIAGAFPFSGFFGKGAVLNSVSGGVYYLLLLIEFLSTLYIFRWLLVPLRKKDERKATGTKTSYRLLPKSMAIATYALAALAISSSLVYLYLPKYLSGSGSQSTIAFTPLEVLVSLAIFFAGLLISYELFYKKNYGLMSNGSVLQRLLYNNLATNRFYSAVAGTFRWIAMALGEFDYSLYFLIKEGAHGAASASGLLKKLENGSTNTYLAVFVLGFIVIFLLFVL